MSQTACKRCGFPLPIRWLRAGGDLAQSNGIHQCAHRALVGSERPPKSLSHSAELPYVQTHRSNSASAISIIEGGASIKSS
jgi:hypothetical protein